MWSFIPSMDTLLQALLPVFTAPSFATHQEILLGWVMCLGRHTEFQTFEAIDGHRANRKRRHPFDRFYNFFSRSAWSVKNLGRTIATRLMVELNPQGELPVVVDGTLLYKSGKGVFGIGWFHDPVRSTEKRVATAQGNKWVVIALLIPIPCLGRSFCLPIHARLDEGDNKKGEAQLAREMLKDIQEWFPDRRILLVGDGGFSAKTLLRGLDRGVRYVGLMRRDAAVHNPVVAPRKKGQRGPTPKYGPRFPSPREVAKKADRARSPKSAWQWTTIEVLAYSQMRRFDVCSFQATWPKVLGERVIQVVVCRSLDIGYGDICLYTTDLDESAAWVVETYSHRNAIEHMFKDSKQVMKIQQPRHWCESSIKKLAPWVWFSQSLISLWYLTDGRHLPEAEAARAELGPWETEWSYRHIFRLLRRLTLRRTINAMSSNKRDMAELIDALESYLYLAA